jgi:hypothetical protein
MPVTVIDYKSIYCEHIGIIFSESETHFSQSFILPGSNLFILNCIGNMKK